MTRVSYFVVGLCCCIGGAIACSSSSSGTPTAPSADGGGLSGDSSISAPPAEIATAQACEAIIQYDQRCSDTTQGKSNKCADDRKKDCGKVVPTMNRGFGDALIACFTTTAACGEAVDCVATKLIQATPTAAQTKVRDDYCTTCGAAAGPNCQGDFFRIGADGNGDGFIVLQASEALVHYLDAKCTGAALDQKGFATCRDAFNACVGAVSSGASPQLPESCQAPQPPPPPDEQPDAGPADAGRG